ncbi:hypothetical protein [Streptomyces sp. NRRL F-5630]|uniref:SCO2583 family membrane protein n=1 Tax=Streptomyces sp. NRRL F-5630 TaxID=1463864 RepID=UPI003D71BBE7
MAGATEPPEGIPPEGGGPDRDEEYRSVVFDESFVNAARLQELSADERLQGEHTPAVRSRPRRGLNRQLIAMAVVIVLAFATAVFMGVRTGEVTASSAAARRTEPLRTTVIPLAPPGTVQGARSAADVYAASPAAAFRTGAAGITVPKGATATQHYTQGQVIEALRIASDYLVSSSLDPRVLSGGPATAVRALVDEGQWRQFDASMNNPRPDGRHAATGWVVRFDPHEVSLADPRHPARVNGTLRVEERGGTLEVTSDHVFAYALRAPKPGSRVSLLSVRREIHFRIDPADLRGHRAEVLTSTVQAGPLDCATESADRLHPLLAGARASGGGPAQGTDPYAPDASATLCGTLAEHAPPTKA